MPAKPNSRNWNDIQITIAAAAIVTTLGLWNLFAEPAKTITLQADQPVLPPPPTEQPIADEPVIMPQVKIMFTQTAPQTSIVSNIAQPQKVKKKKNNNNGGGGTVTVTKTS